MRRIGSAAHALGLRVFGIQQAMAHEQEIERPDSDSSRRAALVVTSPQMIALLETATRAAASEGKVLITGESGVGKDLVARHIHEHSRRSARPFVAVNCAALTDSLLESELFGHVKGSFTGAYRDKPGKLQMAHRGTIFLDEVGEMSLRMQAMLLRFLENGEIQAVGSDATSTRVDVRVMAATNRNLPELIAAGPVSRGPDVSPAGDSPRGAAAARAPRGYPLARGALRGAHRAAGHVHGRSDAAAGAISLARQCARAPQRGRADGVARRRRHRRRRLSCLPRFGLPRRRPSRRASAAARWPTSSTPRS